MSIEEEDENEGGGGGGGGEKEVGQIVSLGDSCIELYSLVNQPFVLRMHVGEKNGLAKLADVYIPAHTAVTASIFPLPVDRHRKTSKPVT